jgi:hypothetical protein
VKTSRRNAIGRSLLACWVGAAVILSPPRAVADPDYNAALKRAQYLLNATMPTDDDLAASAASDDAYKTAVRGYIDGPNFYDAVLRYHEKLFGTGLDTDYLQELNLNDIDNKTNKVASITCNRDNGDGRYSCYFTGQDSNDPTAAATCPQTWEQPVSVFWYPSVVAWVCPEVVNACGSDLSRCFIEYQNAADAENAEFGTTEIFDSQIDITNSLSRQAAGLATAVVVANYPYTKVLQPGLTAVDGALVHMLHQSDHFDLNKLNLPPGLLDLVNQLTLTDTQYVLVNSGSAADQGGVLSTFGWLRRYEKDRTRANNTYSRLLCRQFTAMLPRVFPADPGNLRTTPGCMGCHSILDPMADFFAQYGEGGNLYDGVGAGVQTEFNNQPGSSLSDLANIISGDNAFATCSVQNVWQWLMGRGFYLDEAPLREKLTSYFVTTNFSFKELVYAIATHPAFIEGSRSDATVGDPLTEPPLGQPPGGSTAAAPCTKTIDFTADIQPKLTQCAPCHNPQSSPRQDLSTQAEWKQWGPQAVTFMASGQMPPGQAGPPLIGPVWDLKEAVRCWLGQNP